MVIKNIYINIKKGYYKLILKGFIKVNILIIFLINIDKNGYYNIYLMVFE